MEGRRLLLMEWAACLPMGELSDAPLDDIRDVCPVQDRFNVSLVKHNQLKML